MRRAILSILCAASCAPAPPPERPLREFRGILHCHTLYSHDSRGTYPEILAADRAARVDFVCITDHPPKGDPGRSLREGWRGVRDGVLFIQGHELAGSNLLAVGIRQPVSGTLPEKIAAIHGQGGVALISHPEEIVDLEPYRSADGMEIYNLHAAWKRRQGDLSFYAQALRLLKEDPGRVFGLLQELDPAVQTRWEDLSRDRPFAAVAGNDAHQNVRIGGIQADPYERSFRFVSTHVWAQELTEEAILEAIRRGRCHVAFAAEGPAPPPGGAVSRVVERGGRPWLVFGRELRRCDLDWPRSIQ
ncbi:MAG: hypothetical protein ACK44W_01575 [Planctomycetota bacterium]